MNSFIHVLGCGDAFSSGGRNHSCFVIKHINDLILMDCGATTLTRLKFAGYDVARITAIIITHFHGDHFGGLPNLILDAEYVSKRTVPLKIFTPPGGKERVESLMEAMYPGSKNLLDKLPVRFSYYEGKECLHDTFRVKGIPVVHTPETNPHGVRVSFDDFTIAFSGDTSWTTSLIELSDQADMFILECNFLDQLSQVHLDYETIKSHLEQINAKSIFLTHMGEDVIKSDKISLQRLEDDQKIFFNSLSK